MSRLIKNILLPKKGFMLIRFKDIEHVYFNGGIEIKFRNEKIATMVLNQIARKNIRVRKEIINDDSGDGLIRASKALEEYIKDTENECKKDRNNRNSD